jgi:hypothetical protein
LFKLLFTSSINLQSIINPQSILNQSLINLQSIINHFVHAFLHFTTQPFSNYHSIKQIAFQIKYTLHATKHTMSSGVHRACSATNAIIHRNFLKFKLQCDRSGIVFFQFYMAKYLLTHRSVWAVPAKQRLVAGIFPGGA